MLAGAQDAQRPGQNWVHWGQEKSGQEGQPELNRTGSWNFIPVLPLDFSAQEGQLGGRKPRSEELGRSEKGLD